LALVGITLILGATFVLVKNALADVSTLLFLALRFSVAAAALGLLFRGAWRRAASKAAIAGGALTGAFLFSGFLLQTAGLRYTTPAKSAFITGLAIPLVPIFGAIFERKAPRLIELLGVAIATAGLALMTLRAVPFAIGRGDLLTLGCAAAFALHILSMGHYASKLGFQALALIQIATAAAIALATFWWAERPALALSFPVLAAVAVTGLLATALAFSVQAWAQQFMASTRTALVFAAEPVFAWLTSFALAGELLSLRAALGAALILTGILIVELKPFSNARPPV
jgi:drug/metabolite transporter (DMT)-like permease